jgi:N-acetylglucosamine-6-phosphate deacetylase
MKTESPSGHNRFSVTGRLLIGGRLVAGALIVEGERIVEIRSDVVGALPEPRFDADIVSPGLVDLQCNGMFGLEVGGDATTLRALAARLPATGVTTFLPTVVSARAAHYRAVVAALAAAARPIVPTGRPPRRSTDKRTPKGSFRSPAGERRRAKPVSAHATTDFVVGSNVSDGSEGSNLAGASLPGLHLEGPLLSLARAGVHDARAIGAADTTLGEVLEELLGAGVVTLVTLAPERPGALALIRRLVGAGVTVALGHTDATFAEAVAGIDAGATLVTHLFNAMSAFHHRAPGALGAALTDDRVAVSLIADGVHAHPAALKLALRAKGADRIVLVTDAVAAAGSAPGDYLLGGLPIASDGMSARLADGTLAGSTLTMDRAVRAMVSLGGAQLADALTMASTVPAARVGLDDRGSLIVGRRADLVLWSANLTVDTTLVAGQLAFSTAGPPTRAPAARMGIG